MKLDKGIYKSNCYGQETILSFAACLKTVTVARYEVIEIKLKGPQCVGLIILQDFVLAYNEGQPLH